MTGTKPTWLFVVVVVFVAVVRPPWRVSPQAQQPTQQPPAYPTTKDGRILDGLTPEDFEIVEDGTPQTVESFDVSADPAKEIVALDVSLSGLPHGDYLFELTVGSGVRRNDTYWHFE